MFLGLAFKETISFVQSPNSESWFSLPKKEKVYDKEWEKKRVNPVGLNDKFTVSKQKQHKKKFSLPQNLNINILQVDLNIFQKKSKWMIFKTLTHKNERWDYGNAD